MFLIFIFFETYAIYLEDRKYYAVYHCHKPIMLCLGITLPQILPEGPLEKSASSAYSPVRLGIGHFLSVTCTVSIISLAVKHFTNGHTSVSPLSMLIGRCRQMSMGRRSISHLSPRKSTRLTSVESSPQGHTLWSQVSSEHSVTHTQYLSLIDVSATLTFNLLLVQQWILVS